MKTDIKLKEIFSRYSQEFTDFIGIELTDVNQLGCGEDCLLHIACRWGLINDVKILLDFGANINQLGDMSLTPLHYAATRGHTMIVSILLKKGANKNLRSEFGNTPLEDAKRNGHLDCANILK